MQKNRKVTSFPGRKGNDDDIIRFESGCESDSRISSGEDFRQAGNNSAGTPESGKEKDSGAGAGER